MKTQNSFGTWGGCERHNRVNCTPCEIATTLDRHIIFRAYLDGRIVAMVFAPSTMGTARTIAGGHTVFTGGWPSALRLLERAIASWTEQHLTFAVSVRHQGIIAECSCPNDGRGHRLDCAYARALREEV